MDSAAKPHYNACSYCGYLDWTVEKYGRVTHKQGCPMRTDPWHQGDPHPDDPLTPIPREAGTMDEPVRNWQEWAEQHSEAAADRDRYRAALTRFVHEAPSYFKRIAEEALNGE